MSEKYVAKYISRSSAIASRMLGGEMMVMSAVDSTFFTPVSYTHLTLPTKRIV